MNILIIGTKSKLVPVHNYCKAEGYNVVCIRTDEHENNTPILYDNAIPAYFDLESELYDNFVPDVIINFKEQHEFLTLEKDLSNKFNLETFLTDELIEFFSTKKGQDKLFKSLDIPTVPNDSETVLIKSELSGGTNFKVAHRSLANKQSGHFQDYLDIDYIISCHFYSDGTKWYHLNNHIVTYEDNCPTESITPIKLNNDDRNTIEDSIRKLSKKITIKNKLFGWQFLKDKDGKLYSIDFNLRPFGGFDMGSYDIDVSDQNWSSYLFGNVPPEYITYTDTIQCFYKKPQQFGYSDVDRVKTKLTKTLKFEVKTYD
jgi:hypothetical protein